MLFGVSEANSMHACILAIKDSPNNTNINVYGIYNYDWLGDLLSCLKAFMILSIIAIAGMGKTSGI